MKIAGYKVTTRNGEAGKTSTARTDSWAGTLTKNAFRKCSPHFTLSAERKT
jgi:hypothetical protein